MLQRVFLEHPQSVEETYFEHARFAGSFSLKLFGAAFAALVHAVIPCLFEKTASKMIIQMHGKIANRGQ